MARKRKNNWPPFVYITKEMLHSPAFKKLTNASRVAYLLLRAQISNKNQTEIIFPYSHAEEFMDRHTFARAIEQLQKAGFIKKIQKGGLYRRTNIYTLVDH